MCRDPTVENTGASQQAVRGWTKGWGQAGRVWEVLGGAGRDWEGLGGGSGGAGRGWEGLGGGSGGAGRVWEDQAASDTVRRTSAHGHTESAEGF